MAEVLVLVELTRRCGVRKTTLETLTAARALGSPRRSSSAAPAPPPA